MMADKNFILEQDDDRPNIRFVLGVAIVTMVVFSVGIAWSVLLVYSQAPESFRWKSPVPRPIGDDTIGIVEQPMFEGDHTLRNMLDAQRQRLHGYGWSNREERRIHIPIEEAMRLVAEGAQR